MQLLNLIQLLKVIILNLTKISDISETILEPFNVITDTIIKSDQSDYFMVVCYVCIRFIVLL
jgi:hypothetical protein